MPEKFTSPQEELEYLRARVKEQQEALGTPESRIEHDRIAKREIQAYAAEPAANVLHETVILPEHDIIHHRLHLEAEPHDKQIDTLLQLVMQHGIRNVLSIAKKNNNPHLEDDLHRALVRYVAEGLPDRGGGTSEKVRRALNMVLFEIQPQASGEGSEEKSQNQKLEQILASSEQLYAGLLSLLGDHEGFSLEVAVGEGTEEASLYLAVPHPRQSVAERLIASVFPNARINEKRGDYNVFNYDGHHVAAYAQLHEHPALPLKTYEMYEHDPMNVTLASFAKIAKHGEGAALQIVVANDGDRFNHHYKKILRELERGQPVYKALRVRETAFAEALRKLGRSVLFPDEAKEEKETGYHRTSDQVSTEEITRKIKSRVASVNIRIVTSAKTEQRANDLIDNLIATFAQFDNPRGNHIKFEKVSRWSLPNVLREFTYRAFDDSIVLPLSLAEINAMFHFTAERVTTSRELKRSHSKQAPAPVEMPKDGIVVGINRYGAADSPVHFGSSDRLRHCYVIGQTGTGKTGHLKNMIIQDILNGDGVAFIDPHGNDIIDILAAVPPERAGDVIYFDPAHTARPMGLNMLEFDHSKPEMKTFVVDEVYGIFRKLYSDVPEAFGPMFEQYYRNAVQLVLEDPASGCTFVEVPRLFADHAFRNLKLSRCKNPIIVQFWRKIAEAAGGDAALENVTPYISSKFDVFLANDIMRPIVSQEKSSFDFRKIMDEKKIFLANLSKGRVGDKNMALLGLVLVSKFLQAAFSRVDSHGKDMPTFYLYIDEFQNFATPSIGTILSEARKYRLSLVIAHQFIAQLDEKIRDAVVGNVGTKFSFRIGATDAEFLAKQFTPVFSAKDLENLPNRNAVVSLLVNGVPARPFTIETQNLPNISYERVDALKELSYSTYGRDRDEVEADMRAKFAPPPKPETPEIPSGFYV